MGSDPSFMMKAMGMRTVVESKDEAGLVALLGDCFGLDAELARRAATTVLVASSMGLPVSTTHSIVGAIVGFAAVGIGVEAVKWSKVGTIVMSWVISPLTAGIIAYLIFGSVQRLILRQEDPLAKAKRYVPYYIFFAAFTVTLVSWRGP